MSKKILQAQKDPARNAFSIADAGGEKVLRQIAHEVPVHDIKHLR